MILNIAAYHFVTIDKPEAVAAHLRQLAEANALRGTVLVAGEGLNLFLAGERAAIDAFLDALRTDPRFANMTVKTSESSSTPFARLKVKVKPEIITFRQQTSPPASCRAPAVSPQQLTAWLGQGHDDEGKRIVMLDTRNREEVAHGTFVDALTLPIDNFTELPDAVLAQRDALEDATVVSFCTGGIRCEKAANWLLDQGFTNVLQLEGGILGYFEAVGGAHYVGNCFVFDQRVALDPALRPIATIDPNMVEG